MVFSKTVKVFIVAGVSLMERLMLTCDLYKRRSAGPGAPSTYNSHYITKLVQNYRSHPDILKVPNELFYDNELVACADQMLRERMCRSEILPKQGVPVIFNGVYGQEQREERSPSFFNAEEICNLKKLVEDLLKDQRARIKEEDIGIIAPYRKQVEVRVFIELLNRR